MSTATPNMTAISELFTQINDLHSRTNVIVEDVNFTPEQFRDAESHLSLSRDLERLLGKRINTLSAS